MVNAKACMNILQTRLKYMNRILCWLDFSCVRLITVLQIFSAITLPVAIVTNCALQTTEISHILHNSSKCTFKFTFCCSSQFTFNRHGLTESYPLTCYFRYFCRPNVHFIIHITEIKYELLQFYSEDNGGIHRWGNYIIYQLHSFDIDENSTSICFMPHYLSIKRCASVI